MSIYTKAGDKGTSNLYDVSKGRFPKSDSVFDALGNIDELNSFLGVCISEIGSAPVPVTRKKREVSIVSLLEEVQKNLLRIGSIIAGSKLSFGGKKVSDLEAVIDRLEEKLPRLKNFLLPGGCELASRLHFARSLSRRAERSVVKLLLERSLNPKILEYLNRLSDFLFMLARWANYEEGVREKIWK